MTTERRVNRAQPVSVPWMISPSVSDLQISLREDGDAAVLAEIARLPPTGDPNGELDNCRVEIRFLSGQWLRANPSASDQEVIPAGIFDWSDVPFRGDQGPPSNTFLEDFRARWTLNETCPDPGVYEILSSRWLLDAGATRFGCRHFVVKGHDLWIEVLSRGMSWRWTDDSSSISIETSSIERTANSIRHLNAKGRKDQADR